MPRNYVEGRYRNLGETRMPMRQEIMLTLDDVDNVAAKTAETVFTTGLALAAAAFALLMLALVFAIILGTIFGLAWAFSLISPS